MGAWGAGPFENDDALDRLDKFKERKSAPLLYKVIETNLASADNECEFIVEAELIAALRGHPSADLAPELEDWALKARKTKPPTEALVSSVRGRLERIRDKSELRELWTETDYLADWIAKVDDLLMRLRAAALLPGQDPPRRSPVFENSDGSKKWKITRSILSSSEQFDHVTIRLSQQFEDEELRIAGEFVERHPQTQFCLTDHPSKRSFKFDPDLLLSFREARQIDVWINSLNSMAPFGQYVSLESISIRRVGKLSSLLPPLVDLLSLRKMVLHNLDAGLLNREQKHLHELRNLKKLEIANTLSGTVTLDGVRDDTNYEQCWRLERTTRFPEGLLSLELKAGTLEGLEFLDTLTQLQNLNLNTVVLPENSEIDLSRHSSLRFLNLSRVSNLTRLRLPPGLKILGIRDCPKLIGLEPPFSTELQLSSIAAENFSNSALRLSQWAPNLRALLFYGLELDSAVDYLDRLNRLEFAYLHPRHPCQSAVLPDLPVLRCLTIDQLPRGPLKIALPACIEELSLGYYFDIENPRDSRIELGSFAFLKSMKGLRVLQICDRETTEKVTQNLGLKFGELRGSFWQSVGQFERDLMKEDK